MNQTPAFDNLPEAKPDTDVVMEAEATAPAKAEAAPVAPTWFSPNFAPEKTSELAEKYRHVQSPVLQTLSDNEAYQTYRRRIEERIAEGQKRFDPEKAEPVLAPPTPQRRARMAERPVSRKQPKAKSNLLKPVGFGLVAIAFGSMIGFAASNPDRVTDYVSRVSAMGAAAFATAPTAAPAAKTAPAQKIVAETVIEKKEIKTTSLDVQDVKGLPNTPIALSIVSAADLDAALNYRISGVPDQSYLTAGVEIGKGDWLLKPEDLEQAKLVVAQSAAPRFDLEVSAIETETGQVASPAKAINVEIDLSNVKVQPAAAPPEQGFVQAKAELPVVDQITPQPEILALVAKGEALLQGGDVDQARQFFTHAEALGSGEGAFGIGKTYDPTIFAALNVRGVKPDRDKAISWYEKAVAAGVVDAESALQELQQSVN
jgi:hypothetical protein